jgi:hypothetical protein
MSTRTSTVRKAFVGVWIAAAVTLFIAGRIGGAIDAVTEPRLAPVRGGESAPAVIVSREAGARVSD